MTTRSPRKATRVASALFGLSFLALAVFQGGCKKSGGDAPDEASDAPPPPPKGATNTTPVKPMTGAQGSTCAPEGNFGCSPDGVHELKCVNGNWQTFRACRGPNKCRIDGNKVRCDYGPLMPGDVCNPPLAAMCTADQKGVLGCQNNRLSVIQTCTGGQKCVKGTGAAACK